MPETPQANTSAGGDSLLGRTIAGKFRLETLLGEGAMGKVYRAEHLSLSQQVAVKVLHPHLAGDENLGRRFHREAKSAFTLNHPNSITVYDFGQDEDGLLYIAMELLEGRSLHDVIASEGPLPLERTVRILSQVCLALDEAHHKGIVHRDLKPENIMVQDRRGEPDFVKVCDFGIAKAQDARGESAITMAGMVCGTPEYMSPEQARGDPLDGRSDLYSLGVILYQMATQRLPFTAETALGCVTKHLTEEPPSPRSVRPDLDIPPVLDAFILRCLSKDPEARPCTAAAFREALEQIAQQVARGETAPPSEAATQPAAAEQTLEAHPVRARRSGLLWVVLGGVAVALVGVVAFLVFGREGARSEGAAESSRVSRRFIASPADAQSPVAWPDARASSPRPGVRAPTAHDAAAPRPRDRARPPRLRDQTRRHRLRPGRRRASSPRARRRAPAERQPPEQPGASAFDVAFRAAQSAWSRGAYGAALKHYRAALQARPGHAQSLRRVAGCYVRMGRPCIALRWYRRYRSVRPGDRLVANIVKQLSTRCGK